MSATTLERIRANLHPGRNTYWAVRGWASARPLRLSLGSLTL